MSDPDPDAYSAQGGASRGSPRRRFAPTGLTGDVLVVDGCATSSTMLTQILGRAGYRTRSARDGQEAAQAIATASPGVLLLDIDVDGIDAPVLVDWLNRPTSDVSTGARVTLFLSNTPERERREEAFRRGGADFLVKPVDADELLLRVGMHLQLTLQQQALRRSFEEREAEVQAQLRQSNRKLLKLHAAVEQSPSSVVIADLEGRIEYVNRRFTDMTGYAFEEVRGASLSMYDAHDTPSNIKDEVRQTLGQGRVWHGAVHKKRKDGSLYWERTVIAPVRAEGGDAITHFIAFKEDVTAEREIEAQLQQAQKMEAIGQLAAGIAHEINTPAQFVSDNLSFLKAGFDDLLELMLVYRRALAGIAEGRSQTELLADLRDSEELFDFEYVRSNAPSAFESSLDGLRRIASIVRAMKEFSHPDQREMEPADLNAAIINTLTIARNEYKYVADVEKSLGELPPVLCYVGDICQVVLNLLVNAAHAIDDVVRVTGKRGLIRVRSFAEAGFVRIEIEDNGTGIPEAVREHVFEPFFTTKEVGKGTGQGLALAHNIVVKKHHGMLSFETVTGKGTTFVVRLPTGAAT